MSIRIKIDPSSIAEVPIRRIRDRMADRHRYLILVFDHGLKYTEPGYGRGWREAWQEAGRPQNWAAYQIYPFAKLMLLPDGFHVVVATDDVPMYVNQHTIAWPLGKSASS